MAPLGLLSALVTSEVYVSPYGSDRNAGIREAPYFTLNRVIKQAHEWRRLNRPEAAGRICICLEDGVYAQFAPLFIRPEDSGMPDSPTLIRTVENAYPVIGGGVTVTGWRKGRDDPRITKELRSKIWVAKVPSSGDKIVETRQMWVDGNKAQRVAQFPDGVMERMIDFSPEEQMIIIPAFQIGSLLNVRRLEMIVHQHWVIAILRVKSIDVRGERAVIRFHEPENHLELAHPWPQPVIGGEKGNSSFYLTNALELLDQPGERFQEYPSGTIYYHLRSEEDMETTEVIVSALETLMTVDGTSERPMRHIRAEGIIFAHTPWMRPSYQGHVALQGGFPLLDAYKLYEPGLSEKAGLGNQAWAARPETAMRIRGTEHLTFSRCRFRHLASIGLDYEWVVSSSGIENYVFSDIGGTGILIGAFPGGGFETRVPFIPPEECNLCTDITTKNNLIADVTNEDWGCVGIGAGYVSGIDISRNEVCHLNYSGIRIGWGWTSLESGMKNSRIEANYVHYFARCLYNTGGLYTFSNQPGSAMRDNRIERLEEAPYATNDRAFYTYLDEATDGYMIENNWRPTERFDSNRPGNRNVWKNNGS